MSLSLQGRSEQSQEDAGCPVAPVLFLVQFISLLHTIKKILISAPLFVHLEDGASLGLLAGCLLLKQGLSATCLVAAFR